MHKQRTQSAKLSEYGLTRGSIGSLRTTMQQRDQQDGPQKRTPDQARMPSQKQVNQTPRNRWRASAKQSGPPPHEDFVYSLSWCRYSWHCKRMSLICFQNLSHMQKASCLITSSMPGGNAGCDLATKIKKDESAQANNCMTMLLSWATSNDAKQRDGYRETRKYIWNKDAIEGQLWPIYPLLS